MDKPPLPKPPPDRCFKLTILGERETKESKQATKEWQKK